MEHLLKVRVFSLAGVLAANLFLPTELYTNLCLYWIYAHYLLSLAYSGDYLSRTLKNEFGVMKLALLLVASGIAIYFGSFSALVIASSLHLAVGDVYLSERYVRLPALSAFRALTLFLICMACLAGMLSSEFKFHIQMGAVVAFALLGWMFWNARGGVESGEWWRLFSFDMVMGIPLAMSFFYDFKYQDLLYLHGWFWLLLPLKPGKSKSIWRNGYGYLFVHAAPIAILFVIAPTPETMLKYIMPLGLFHFISSLALSDANPRWARSFFLGRA